MITLVLFSSCIFGLGGKPLDFYAGYKGLAFSFARHIENGKRVVVMNFVSDDPSENKTTSFDSYLARYFTTFLIEGSNGRFSVIDRAKGESLFVEDMKYEIIRKTPEEILKEFQCDYYITGRYILRYQKLEFTEISLMKGPIKVYSVSKSFKLTEEQNNDFKGLSQEDVIIKYGRKLIEELKKSGDPGKIILASVLERLLEEYIKATKGDSKIYEKAKKAFLDYILPILLGTKK